MMQARRQLHKGLRSSRALLLGFTPVVATLAGHVPLAHAQALLPIGMSEPAVPPGPSTIDGSIVTEGAPPHTSEREWFAVTFNPLNLIINRYAVDLQLQPTKHHTLVITPHYEYLSGQYDSDHCCYTDTFNGGGTEVGYRYYTGRQAFEGFYAGPSLLISAYHLKHFASRGGASPYDSETSFINYGGAIDIGYQWQLGRFTIGLGCGLLYTQNSKKVELDGDDVDVWIGLHAHDTWLPRLAINLGFAI